MTNEDKIRQQVKGYSGSPEENVKFTNPGILNLLLPGSRGQSS
jgi:hypothetical protein